MKKYLVILASAIAALTMASCTKEEAAKVPANGTTISLQAKLDNETKTVSAESSPLLSNWLSTDRLTVIYSHFGETDYSKAYQFTCADAAEGLFYGAIDETLTYDDEDIYSWYMVYPYSKYITAVKPSDPIADTDGYFTIGSKTQTQNGINSFKHALAGSNAPLIGMATSGEDWTEPAEMHHLTSVLQFNITNTDKENDLLINSIEFVAPVEISGTYCLDFSDVDNIVYNNKNANKSVTLNVKEGTIPAGETASFYIVTKPFDVTAKASCTITIKADAGNVIKTWTPTEKVSVEAGHIKAFNIDFVAPKSTSFAEIFKGGAEGTFMTSSATVVAAGLDGSSKYAVAYDGTYWMVLFNSKINSTVTLPAVGTNYQVAGDVACYYGLMEWSYADLTELGAATAIVHPDVQECTAEDLANYITNSPTDKDADPAELLRYIKIPVTVSNGTVKDGDYTINPITTEGLVNGTGTLTGYLIGYNSSKTRFNLIVTESDIKAEETPEISEFTLTASNISQSSYSSAVTFYVGSYKFGHNGVMSNNKNAPTGYGSGQLMQMRKANGEIHNETAIDGIKTIKVYSNSTNAFKLEYGSTSDLGSSLKSSDVTPTTESVSYTDNNGTSQSGNFNVYEFDLSSEDASYFKVTNTDSKALYLSKIIVSK